MKNTLDIITYSGAFVGFSVTNTPVLESRMCVKTHVAEATSRILSKFNFTKQTNKLTNKTYQIYFGW